MFNLPCVCVVEKCVRVTSTVRVNSTSLCLSGIELYILGEHLFILNVLLNFFALFKKIVALGYLIQQKYRNDIRNMLP